MPVQVIAYGPQIVPDRGVVRSCDLLQKIWGFNHIDGTAEPKVIKFCTQAGRLYQFHQQDEKGAMAHGYGHVTVLKICRLS